MREAVADAVRMEWVRLRTLRSTAVLVGLALLLPAAIAFLIGSNSEAPMDPGAVLAALTAGSGLTPLPLPAVLVGVLGVLSVGHDYEHGTVRALLTTVPRRPALLTGRLLVLAGVVAVIAVAGLVLDAAALVTGRGATVDLGGTAAGLAGYVLLLVLWVALGVGLALILRASAGPITLLFVVPLLVEPLLGVALQAERLRPLRPLARYLPFQAGRRLAAPIDPADVEALTRWQGGLVFAAFTAIVVAIGWSAFTTRDA